MNIFKAAAIVLGGFTVLIGSIALTAVLYIAVLSGIVWGVLTVLRSFGIV